MVAANDILLYTHMNNHFTRVDTRPDASESFVDLDLMETYQESSTRLEEGSVWMDSKAEHVIFSMLNGDIMYYHYEEEKVKKPQKIKGLVGRVTAVAWDIDRDVITVLLGMEKGELYYSVVDAPNFVNNAKFNLAYNFQSGPIENISIVRFANRQNKMSILVTGISSKAYRLYHFVGHNNIAQVFSSAQDPHMQKELPLPKEEKDQPRKRSLLRIHESKVENVNRLVFGWLTDTAFVFGEFNLTESTISNVLTFSHPEKSYESIPDSFVITPYHVIFLTHQRLIGVSRLLLEHNEKDSSYRNAADWEYITKGPAMIGFAEDTTMHKIWIYHTPPRVSLLQIQDEKQNLWDIYLTLENYKKAEEYAPKERKEQVYEKQIEFYEQNKNFDAVAIAYAQSSVHLFSDVCLKFIYLNQTDALITYIRNKLNGLKYHNAAHKTILATWLLELFLKRLDSVDMDSKLSREEAANKKLKLEDEIKSFLKDHKEDLEKADKTVFHLLSTFGQTDILHEWSRIRNDYHKLIEWCIQKKHYYVVQELIKKSDKAVIYQHAPLLMFHTPETTVETLISLGPDTIEPEKLLLALLRCDYRKYKGRVKEDPVVKYLEFAIKRSKTAASKAIHNLLLARYAQQDEEGPLEEYIRRPDSNFGLDFGLQLCLRTKHMVSAVLIYAKMGMFEESVELALNFGAAIGDWNMTLAKEIARKPDDVDRKKTLMKQIVEFLVEKKQIPRAMETVQHSTDLLSIEDIIKDLPDDMLIEDIANDLCHSLEQSKKKVEELRNKMKSTKETTERIKEEIKQLTARVVPLPEDSTCTLTKLPLRERSFFHYLDGSSFIAEALYDYVKKTPLPPEQAETVERIENEMQVLLRQNGNVETAEVKQMKANLDEIMTTTNPYYSQYFIQSLKMPFISKNEQEIKSWKF